MFTTNSRNLAFIVFLALFLSIIYFNIGTVGYYLDDYSSIVYNPVLQAPIDYAVVIEKQSTRMVSYLALALQNELFSGSAAGFHYVGLSIHFIVSLIVYLLANRLFKKTELKNSGYLAAIVSVLFAFHPQNSQAVVYIVQQTAMYVTLFYLLALYAYVSIRTATTTKDKMIYAVILVLSAALAMLSKQNALTLPFAILLIEACLFKQYSKHIAVVIFLGALASLVALALVKGLNLEQLSAFINDATIENKLISRDIYFYTQIGVVADYIKQFFYPLYFRLEFDYQLIKSLNEINVFSFGIHIVLIASALSCRRVYPLVTFGILFYYLAHSVESSFIPITDLAFEHRNYLPNVGLLIASVVLCSVVVEKIRTKRKKEIVWLLMASIMMFLATQTHNRVNQWADTKAFYLNEVELSPNSPRAYTELAKIYIEQGDCPLAIGVSEHAINLYEKQRKSGLSVQPEFYQNYVLCLRELGIYDKADYFELHLLTYVKEPVRRSYILFQRGSFMLEQRQFAEAEKYLTESIKLNGKNVNTAINLAITKVQLGKNGHAIKLLEHAVALKPNDQKIKELLSKLLAGKN